MNEKARLKAIELIEKHIKVIPAEMPFNTAWEIAKKQATITVEEMLSLRYLLKQEVCFYEKVRNEIEKQ